MAEHVLHNAVRLGSLASLESVLEKQSGVINRCVLMSNLLLGYQTGNIDSAPEASDTSRKSLLKDFKTFNYVTCSKQKGSFTYQNKTAGHFLNTFPNMLEFQTQAWQGGRKCTTCRGKCMPCKTQLLCQRGYHCCFPIAEFSRSNTVLKNILCRVDVQAFFGCLEAFHILLEVHLHKENLAHCNPILSQLNMCGSGVEQ